MASVRIPFDQPQLQTLVDNAVGKTLAEFAKAGLARDQLAVTLMDLAGPAQPIQASYRGDMHTYPASVIKLFYLVAAHRQLEDRKLADAEELRRAMHDMIVYSYNEATGYIMDLLTGTTSGPELPPDELERWQEKRNAVNRYFTSLGYTGVNANRKTWCEGPYGRETQAMKAFKPEKNFLTTNATARLLTEIITGRAVTAARCEQMKALLKRDFSQPGDSDEQAHKFTSPALPPTARLWSKAGYMSTARHDAAYIELTNGARFVLVVFSVNHSEDHGIIPSVARVIVDAMDARY